MTYQMKLNNVESYLAKDTIYIDYLNSKAKYKSIRHSNTNVYDYVKSIFNSKLQKSKAVEKIYFTEVFNNTVDKTFTAYLKELYNHRYIKDDKGDTIDVSKEYDVIIESTVVDCINLIRTNDDIEVIDIMKICNIHYTLDKYIGFMMEYVLQQTLINNGFSVMNDIELDNLYKIDLLVGHPNSPKAIAIQCKSISYLNKKDSFKNEHIERMESFKNKGFRRFKALENIIDIDLKYMLHNNDQFATIGGNALIDTDKVKGYVHLDIDENLTALKHRTVYDYKSLNAIVLEIYKALGL